MIDQQVETVGRVYMAASGAPDRTADHAINIADVSLQLVAQVRSLVLPSGLDIQIRIGKNIIAHLIIRRASVTEKEVYRELILLFIFFLFQVYILGPLLPGLLA